MEEFNQQFKDKFIADRVNYARLARNKFMNITFIGSFDGFQGATLHQIEGEIKVVIKIQPYLVDHLLNSPDEIDGIKFIKLVVIEYGREALGVIENGEYRVFAPGNQFYDNLKNQQIDSRSTEK